jgi:signal peptidase
MFKKALTLVLNIVVTGFLVVAGLLALSTFSLFGLRSFVVLSGSMEPAVHTGSIALVRPLAEYGVGDIVTKRTSDEGVTITHRIIREEIGENGKSFVLKGDANEAQDAGLTPESDIIGRVFFSIPYLGFVVEYVKKPVGFILLIVIPAVIIIYEELGRMRREAVLLWKKRAAAQNPVEPEEEKPEIKSIFFEEASDPYPEPVKKKRKIV